MKAHLLSMLGGFVVAVVLVFVLGASRWLVLAGALLLGLISLAALRWRRFGHWLFGRSRRDVPR
jgi:hypothetical protein